MGKWIGMRFLRVQPHNRTKEYVEQIFLRDNPNKGEGDPLKLITAPCGEVYEFVTKDDIPLETMMCRCGNTRHYVVLWEND